MKFHTKVLLSSFSVFMIPILTMAIHVSLLDDSGFLAFLDMATLESKVFVAWLFFGLAIFLTSICYCIMKEGV